ncbi:hypothetical protein XMM354_003318 [Aliiroseovarius sp. xm-m-354]|nr:hypothetical protein [Aliiroseovarius sp. xm-m-354]
MAGHSWKFRKPRQQRFADILPLVIAGGEGKAGQRAVRAVDQVTVFEKQAHIVDVRRGHGGAASSQVQPPEGAQSGYRGGGKHYENIRQCHDGKPFRQMRRPILPAKG